MSRAVGVVLGVASILIGHQSSWADSNGLTWIYSKPTEIEFTKSEITVAQYRGCVNAGKCSVPMDKNEEKTCNWGYSGRDRHPINCVDWNQAIAFCAWAGGRLPTENEWFAEASDGGKRKYAWGNEKVTCGYAVWNPGSRGCGRDSTWPVCSKPKGNSVSGLCDMTGNVWEWTSTVSHFARIVRGGSWGHGYMDPDHLLASYREFYTLPNEPTDALGFRCVRSPE